MFAIGCIQAQACHTNHCPVGVATQDPLRARALDVTSKSERVARFHRNTLKALGEMTGAAGLTHPGKFMPQHMMLRQGDKKMVEASDAFAYLPEGFLLSEGDETGAISDYRKRWHRASAESFASPGF
jgi:hypothetical protein